MRVKRMQELQIMILHMDIVVHNNTYTASGSEASRDLANPS